MRALLCLPGAICAVWAAVAVGQDGTAEPGPAGAAASVEETADSDVSGNWRGVARLKERIEGEIVELKALAAAQAALVEWNRARAAADLPPAALSADVCVGDALEAWCPLLPATFVADGAAGSFHGGR